MSSQDPGSVSAVIVTWNPDLSRLREVLRSVVPQVADVVVVDNGSTDQRELRSFITEVGDVFLIGLSENLGIGAALNIGIRKALLSAPTWVLSLDQDTVIGDSAIQEILGSYLELDEDVRRSIGIIGMRTAFQRTTNWFTTSVERLMFIQDLGSFEERLGVITSGTLMRADVAELVHFNELLFIDQVDFDFCYSSRRLGYRVIRQKKISMDHTLGKIVVSKRGIHPYESAERLYYIVRNSTFLVLRRRLPVRFYLMQIVVFNGAYLSVNGGKSLVHCLMIDLKGLVDGVLSRLGKRNYPMLYRGRR